MVNERTYLSYDPARFNTFYPIANERVRQQFGKYERECCGATYALHPWRGSSVDSGGVYSRSPLLSVCLSCARVICVWTIVNFLQCDGKMNED